MVCRRTQAGNGPKREIRSSRRVPPPKPAGLCDDLRPPDTGSCLPTCTPKRVLHSLNIIVGDEIYIRRPEMGRSSRGPACSSRGRREAWRDEFGARHASYRQIGLMVHPQAIKAKSSSPTRASP